jgi:hypothetical protein
MVRPAAEHFLDPDFESVDRGGFIERRADLRERDRHGRLRFAARRFGRAANAPNIALLARRVSERSVFGERHRRPGLGFQAAKTVYPKRGHMSTKM